MGDAPVWSLPPIVSGSRFVIGVALRSDGRWYPYVDNYVPPTSSGDPTLTVKICASQGFDRRELAEASLPLLKTQLQTTLRKMGFEAMALEIV